MSSNVICCFCFEPIRQQFWDRIDCYLGTGNITKNQHNSKKMEVILSGGTWESYPLEERNKFKPFAWCLRS